MDIKDKIVFDHIKGTEIVLDHIKGTELEKNKIWIMLKDKEMTFLILKNVLIDLTDEQKDLKKRLEKMGYKTIVEKYLDPLQSRIDKKFITDIKH